MTAAVPVEVKVIGCIDGLLTVTVPNGMLVALIVSVGTAAFSCSKKVLELLPNVAVSVTDWDALTAEADAVKAALVAFAATVTVAGTVTAELLLDKVTAVPPLGAAALNIKEQASFPAPVNEFCVHESAASVGATVIPVPLKLTTAVLPVDELLAIDNCADADPVVVGSNCTAIVAV